MSAAGPRATLAANVPTFRRCSCQSTGQTDGGTDTRPFYDACRILCGPRNKTRMRVIAASILRYTGHDERYTQTDIVMMAYGRIVASISQLLLLLQPFNGLFSRTTWYGLTRVVPDKGPLNGRVCVCVSY